eukprot:45391-Rhodomonas_salina.1
MTWRAGPPRSRAASSAASAASPPPTPAASLACLPLFLAFPAFAVFLQHLVLVYRTSPYCCLVVGFSAQSSVLSSEECTQLRGVLFLAGFCCRACLKMHEETRLKGVK